MEKLFYPALFHKSEEGGFWISFPDFPECFTEGDDMKQAYEMTVEALGLALVNRKEEKEEIPDPSDLDKIQNEDGTIVIVEFDMLEYQRKHNSKAVKKTLSIPEWLNEEAVSMGVNFFASTTGSVDEQIEYKQINWEGLETQCHLVKTLSRCIPIRQR